MIHQDPETKELMFNCTSCGIEVIGSPDLEVCSECFDSYYKIEKEDKITMQKQTSTKESSGFEKPKIPAGMYKGTLKEIKEISEGKYGARVVFVYNVKVAESNEVEIGHIAYNPDEVTKGCKFGMVLIAHGIALDGSVIDTEKIIGTEANVWVEDYEYESEEEIEHEGKKVIAKTKKMASSINKITKIDPAQQTIPEEKANVE